MATEKDNNDYVRYLILQKFSNGYSLSVPGNNEGPTLVQDDGNQKGLIFQKAGEKILAEKLSGAQSGNYIQVSYKVNRTTSDPSERNNEVISNNMTPDASTDTEIKYMEYTGLYNAIMKEFFLSAPLLTCYRIEPQNKDDKPMLLFLGDSAYFVSEAMKVKLETISNTKPGYPPIPFVKIPASVWNMKRLAAINPKAVPIPKTPIQMTSLINKNKQKFDLIRKDIDIINEKENKAIADAAASSAKGKKGK